MPEAIIGAKPIPVYSQEIVGKESMDLSNDGYWSHSGRNRWLVGASAALIPAVLPSEFNPKSTRMRSFGQVSNGELLLRGKYAYNGEILPIPENDIWAIQTVDRQLLERLHGFVWLEDLVAVRSPESGALARTWITGWIERFGDGGGPGWLPETTARRLIWWTRCSWIMSALWEQRELRPIFASMVRQSRYVGIWRPLVSNCLHRIELAVSRILVALHLNGSRPQLNRRLRQLVFEGERLYDLRARDRIRNPQELLQVGFLLHLIWQLMVEAGINEARGLRPLLTRVGSDLGVLQLCEGMLTRFHDGGETPFRMAALVLAELSPENSEPVRQGMGYVQLRGGRTRLIIDAAPPPSRGSAARTAHASTLAFEMASGETPLFVNCGSGRRFGDVFENQARWTSSYNTLEVLNRSSSKFVPLHGFHGKRAAVLKDGPTKVRLQIEGNEEGTILKARHDGYKEWFEATHERQLAMSVDGRTVAGKDSVIFGSELPATGIPFTLRFHAHPDVEVSLDSDGQGAMSKLRNGESWQMRFSGPGSLAVKESTYLDESQCRVRTGKLVELRCLASRRKTSVLWWVKQADNLLE